MVLVHHCRKPDDQALPPTRHLGPLFLPHNLNKVIAVTQPISSKDMDFTVVKQAVSMVVWEELEVTRPPDKATRTANTEVTKASEEATTMVTTNSSAEDGVATTDTNLAWIVTTRPGRLPSRHLWGVVISTKNLCY
jgi:hypothetical protein